MTRSTYSIRHTQSYRCLNCLLTKKHQTISFIILSTAFVVLVVGLLISIVHYYGFLTTKINQEYNIEAAMASGLMLDCDYVVTPWYINLCQNQDNIETYAWRQFKLLKTDKPDCVDVHERTPCRDSNLTIKPNRTILWPSACPIGSVLAESVNEVGLVPDYPSWVKDLGNISEASIVVKMPLISDLKPYLNQTIRAMDLLMICPNCFYRSTCDGTVYNYRNGWPYSFSHCSFKFSKDLCPDAP